MKRNNRFDGRGRRGADADLFSAARGRDSADAVVEGTVESVTFANGQTGWSVLRMVHEKTRRLYAAVGLLPGVRPGEHLRLHGRWVTDPRFGEQFQVDSFVTIEPTTLPGMERYLASGLIRGVGKVMASRLVGRFGLDTLEVLDNHPERLEEIEGIGPKKRQGISRSWAEQRSLREVMLFLQSHGVSTAYAVRIFKKYGQSAIGIVKENPYLLAVDIAGIGFASADRIAAALGFPPDSASRIEAGLLHALGEITRQGNVFAPLAKVREQAVSLLEADGELVDGAMTELAEQGRIVIDHDAEETAVYLEELYEAEVRVALRLRDIVGQEIAPPGGDVDADLDRFEKNCRIELAGQQRRAVRRAAASPVLVVTGGPGTGKTTIVNAIVRLFEGRKQKVLLCAPTGRAAKRIEESAAREARTIHRLLEYNPGRQRFERNSSWPLEADLVVIDEMSMVDVPLFDSLLDAVPDGCRLVLVGDIDQLPSVGPGNVLKDLIRSGAVDVVVLREIFRQARESHIVLNAHRVNGGELPEQTPGKGEERDFYFIVKDEPADILATVKTLVSGRIPGNFGVDPVEDIQVLTPMHRGELGAMNLNAVFQELLNPEGAALKRGGRNFRMGDKVMQVRNNYDLGVFNGDLGRIGAVDEDEGTTTIRFDGRDVIFERSDLEDVVLGYACTIHKAQGSEYPVVVMPLHTQHYVLLQRNLLYTGITRGKKLVVLVGSERAVSLAVGNNRVRRRYTRLAERIAAEGENQASPS